MKSVFLNRLCLSVATWCLMSACAHDVRAHDLDAGRFDTSQIRPDVIEFVAESKSMRVISRATQTAEELVWQNWIDDFVREPLNAPFFGDQRFKFYISAASEPNAFVTLNGTVQVNVGLLDIYKGRPELIKAILAHELAHVSRAHSLRGAAKFIGKDKIDAPIFEQGKCIGYQVCKRMFQFFDSRRMSRLFEFEADHVALQLLDNARLDPAHLPVALQVLDDAIAKQEVHNNPLPKKKGRLITLPIRKGFEAIVEACSTHPETCDRVVRAVEEIKEHRYRNAWTEVPKPRGSTLKWVMGVAKKIRL